MSARSDYAAAFGKLGWLRWALSTRHDDAIAYVVLIVMAAAGNTSGECWMSVERIADQAGCHRRTAQRKLHLLLRAHFIEDVSTNFPNRRTRTYRFCTD